MDEPRKKRAYTRRATGERLCTARSSQHKRPCRHYAIKGGTVCLTHGGRAPQVKRKALERLQDLVDPNRVLRAAAELAYSDITQLMDEKGNIKPVRLWPANIRSAVSGIEVTKRNLTAGDDAQEDVVKVKLWDKPKLLELLMKHLGLLIERLALVNEDELMKRLEEGRKRNAAAPR